MLLPVYYLPLTRSFLCVGSSETYHPYGFKHNKQKYSILLYPNISVKPLYNRVKVPYKFVVRSMLSAATFKSKEAFLEAQKLFLNKTILYNFCQHFKTIPRDIVENDKTFIEYVNKCIHGTPTLQSRAFQLALEISYTKRQFSEQDLQKYYENDFNIVDTFKVNKGICDQSTIFTSVITKDIMDYYSYGKSDVIVHSTPIFLTKEKITPMLEQTMIYNKTMTGNTCPDISIQERPYDYKDSKDFSYNKNHIYIVDNKDFLQDCKRHLNHITAIIENNIRSLKDIQLRAYSKDILRIIKNESISVAAYEKIVLFTKQNTPPKEFKMPIFIFKPKANLEELVPTDNAALDEIKSIILQTGPLNSAKVKQSVFGLLNAWPNHLKETINKNTANTLDLLLSDNHE